jgi:anaerobic selenocysteine-containing dehydrogenase
MSVIDENGLWFLVSGLTGVQNQKLEARNQKPETDDFMKRREFIILSSVGAASASLLSACRHPEEKLIPALIPDDEYVPGIDYWKASTCGMCPAGCGIVVRTREHQANKIEGNPLHPVNRGALCARGQAGLQVLYNPDRIKGPMRRAGERGEGKWEEISWDKAIKTVADRLRDIKFQGQANRVAFATNDLYGITGIAIRNLMSAYDSPILLTTESPRNMYETSSYQMSYGASYTPIFDIANATYLLSFGARFLETWHSPVMYSQAYGEFRRTKNRARGRFVQVEPRMSLTAANADEWLPASPGMEGFVALAIAQVIIRENLIKDAIEPKLTSGSLEDYAPEKTKEITGIEPEKIIRIAHDFAASERPLAICGEACGALGKGGQEPFLAINFLNTLVGNVNKTGGVRVSSYAFFDLMGKVLSTLPSATQKTSTGSRDVIPSTFSYNLLSSAQPFSALFIHQMNPLFSNPRTIDTIRAIPFIASFASFQDETTQLSDIILPDHTYLESWNIKAIPLTEKQVAVTITQPAVKSEFSSRQAADVLLALSRELNDVGKTFESAEEIVKLVIASLLNPGGGKTTTIKSVGGSEEPADEFKAISEQGVWVGEVDGIISDPQRTTGVTIHLRAPDESDEIKEDYPFILLGYEHPTFGFGEQANLPMLQELPDSMTSVMWGSWVEINPRTAASLGIADGDLVEVSSYHGSVRAPAVLYPAIRPDVIAMPFGQGHTGYGRYATNRGANPAVLNPGLQGTVRAKVSNVAGKVTLIRFGTDSRQLMEKKPWR